MKKTLILCLTFCCILLVGCETKTETDSKKESVLSCSLDTENQVTFNTELSYHFEGDNLVKLGVKYVYDLSSYTDEQRKSFDEQKICETSAMTDTVGLTDCETHFSGTDYIVTGYSDKLKSQSVGTLDEIRKAYEEEGWTCSVK